MRAGKPIARWISPRSEPNSECFGNTIPTCESPLSYAVTLRQNAEFCSEPNVTQSFNCDVILLSVLLSNMGYSIIQRVCTVKTCIRKKSYKKYKI